MPCGFNTCHRPLLKKQLLSFSQARLTVTSCLPSSSAVAHSMQHCFYAFVAAERRWIFCMKAKLIKLRVTEKAPDCRETAGADFRSVDVAPLGFLPLVNWRLIVLNVPSYKTSAIFCSSPLPQFPPATAAALSNPPPPREFQVCHHLRPLSFSLGHWWIELGRMKYKCLNKS